MKTTKKRKQTRTDKKTRILHWGLIALGVAESIIGFINFMRSSCGDVEDTIIDTAPEKERESAQESIYEIDKERTTRKSPDPHLMKLRKGYNMSPEKKAEASEMNIDVPLGYTLRGKSQIA